MKQPQPTNHRSVDPIKIEQLLAKQDSSCVSVLVNLFTAGNMLKQNKVNLKRSIDKAKASIDVLHDAEELKALLKASLERLAASFRNTGTPMGLGIFVSNNVVELIEFPFPVIECTIVSHSFETRDILYLQQYLEPYYALNINKDSMHLYKGNGHSLVEVTSEAFPKHHSPEYEYEHASIGSSHGYSLKGYEKDKGDIANTRQESFVKSAARNLATTINDPHVQLVVAGPARLVNEVESVYPYPDFLTRIDVSFNGKTFSKFSEAVWRNVADARKALITKAIKRVGDLPLNNKAEGLREVWEAAAEGRGLMLLVERDFQRMAYRLTGTNFIRLHPPKERYTVIPDAVDDVIEMVRSKHGRVIFTETGELNRFDGIVMTLRY
ncbi:MAG TPA: hypothetical protein VFE50_08855 [Cyclobacteriaceae bacterium]|nr:hypothetical protein [Cyclobacteriaceae bacterium]